MLADVAVKEAAAAAAEAASVAAAAAKELQKHQESARLLSVALASAQSRCGRSDGGVGYLGFVLVGMHKACCSWMISIVTSDYYPF